jgi:hypothetical protein
MFVNILRGLIAIPVFYLRGLTQEEFRIVKGLKIIYTKFLIPGTGRSFLGGCPKGFSTPKPGPTPEEWV